MQMICTSKYLSSSQYATIKYTDALMFLFDAHVDGGRGSEIVCVLALCNPPQLPFSQKCKADIALCSPDKSDVLTDRDRLN